MVRAALVLLLWQVAGLVYPQTWSFWCIAQLGWTDRMIGLSLALVGLVIALAQMFVTAPVVRRFGERDAATLGLVSATAGFMAYAFTSTGWVALALIACIAGQSTIQPSLMALLSRRAGPKTQGEVQGIAAMTTGIGAIIAPLVLNMPMAYFTGPRAPVHFPGAAFVVAAMFGIAAIVLLRTLPRSVPAHP